MEYFFATGCCFLASCGEILFFVIENYSVMFQWRKIGFWGWLLRQNWLRWDSTEIFVSLNQIRELRWLQIAKYQKESIKLKSWADCKSQKYQKESIKLKSCVDCKSQKYQKKSIRLESCVDCKSQKCQKESISLENWVDRKSQKCQKKSISLEKWVDCKSRIWG